MLREFVHHALRAVHQGPSPALEQGREPRVLPGPAGGSPVGVAQGRALRGDGDGERTTARKRLCERTCLLLRLRRLDLHIRRCQARDQVAQAEVGKAAAHRDGHLPRRPAQVGKFVAERHVAHDRRKALREERLVAIGLEQVADARRSDARRVSQEFLERRRDLEQTLSRLLTDARHAGDAVRGVAHQALPVGDLGGCDAVVLQHGLGVIELRAVERAHQHDLAAPADQLQQVPVARDDGHRELRGEALADRAEHVVRLVARDADHLEAHRAQQFLGERELAQERRVGLLAMRLVALELLVAERAAGTVEGDRDVRGLVRVVPLHEGQEEAVDRARRRAVRGGQRRKGVKRAIEQAHAVDREKALAQGRSPFCSTNGAFAHAAWRPCLKQEAEARASASRKLVPKVGLEPTRGLPTAF